MKSRIYDDANKSERVMAMRSATRRTAVRSMHRARPASGEREDQMESYRNQILAMLDTITDVKLMRLLHDVIRAILFNR